MKSLVWALSIAAGSALVIACGEMKKVDEMHKATMDMSETTKSLAKTSDGMKANTEELYDASRQGTALQLRREAMRQLPLASSSGSKVAEAGKYMMSFEYQLWNGAGQDALPGKRDELMKDAVTELFRDLMEFDSGTELSDPTAQFDGEPHSHNNKDAVFNALAVALQQVNRKQEEMHRARPDVPLVSMLTLIQTALAEEKDINEGRIAADKISPVSSVVLANKALAVRLLQARQQFIPFVFLAETSPLGKVKFAKNAGLFSKAKGAWALASVTGGLAKALVTGWTLDLDRLNLPQTLEFLHYFKAADATREFLVKTGLEPAPRHWIADRMFKKMNVKTEGRGNARVSAARLELFSKLQDLKK